METLGHALEAAAAGEGRVVGVLGEAGIGKSRLEDVHWTDEISARLMAFVGRRLSGRRALLIATAREEEVADAPAVRQALDDYRDAEVWEISRYARAVGEVGPLPSLLGELRQRETRRDHLTAQLRRLAGAASIAVLDPAHVRRNLHERLTDWQGLLRQETI